MNITKKIIFIILILLVLFSFSQVAFAQDSGDVLTDRLDAPEEISTGEDTVLSEDSTTKTVFIVSDNPGTNILDAASDEIYNQDNLSGFNLVVRSGDQVKEMKEEELYNLFSTSDAFIGEWISTDVWNVALPANSNFVKAWVYVPYSGVTGDTIDFLNVTFNGAKPATVFFSRDQANVVSVTGYGLLVYDVTDLIQAGNNTFVINRTNKGGIYPSTLIYLYNTAGSKFAKNVYISNGADLFGTYGNTAGRTLELDTTLKVSSANAVNATAYIFGAESKTGRATIIVNGEENDTAWDTNLDNQINIYTKDISKTVKDANDVSIVLKTGMFTALQQIIVVTKQIPVPTTIVAPGVTKVYNVAKNLVVTLKDNKNNPIANAKVTVTLNGVKKVLTTNAKGQAVLAIANLAPRNYVASISYAGDATHIKSTATAKVVVKKANVRLTAPKKTYKAKVKVKKYTIVLKNNKGKVINKVRVTLKVKGKTFSAVTKNGKATFKITNLKKKGKYTARVTFNSNAYYNRAIRNTQIIVR